MSAPQKSRSMSSENSDEDIARKKVRLDSTIDRLKEKTGGISKDKLKRNDSPESPNDSPESPESTVNIPDKKEQLPEVSVNLLGNSLKLEDKYKESNFRIIPKTDATRVYYCMWENTSNVCWLDASMALVSHNHTLRYKTDLNGSAQIMKIIKYYNEAICSLNDDNLNPEERLIRAKDLLIIVQESSLKYLQPILKYNEGDPESAFCSLFNLISEDKTIKKYFEVKFTRSLICQKCNKKKVTTQTKPIITLPKVRAFQPSFPTALTECPACKSPEQDMIFSYKNLPKCLLFHFEGGAGKGEWNNLNFTLKGREYKVTGLMTLEKARETTMDHFVSWINEPVSNYWLECNDVNPEILKFAEVPPEYIKLEEVCIIMFEAFDDLGTIDLSKAQVDASEKFNLEDEEEDDENIPFIDLSQELEESSRLCSKEDSTSKETNYKKSTAHDCEPEELAFLQSICSSENTSINAEENVSEKEIKSKIKSIPTEQIEMLKQLDLKPKFLSSSKGITPRSHGQKNVDDEQVVDTNKEKIFERQNISLEDCLSPRYTNMLKKLAAKNDEIQKNEVLDQLKSMPGLSIFELNSSQNESKSLVVGTDELISSEVELKVDDNKNVQIDQTSEKLQLEKTTEASNKIIQTKSFKEDTTLKSLSNSLVKNPIQEKTLQETTTDLSKQDLHDQISISCKSPISNMPSSSDNCVLKGNCVQNFPIVKENKAQIVKGNELMKIKVKSSNKTISKNSSAVNSPKNKNSPSLERKYTNDNKSNISKKLSARPPFPIDVKTKVISTANTTKLPTDISEPIFEKSDLNNHSNIAVVEPIKLSSFNNKGSIQINNNLINNDMNLIVTESEEITPENVVESIAEGHIRNRFSSKKGLNTVRRIEEKRKKSNLTDSKHLTSSKISHGESRGKFDDKRQDHADILKNQPFVKLFRLSSEDISKYTCITYDTHEVDGESLKIFDMVDIIENDSGREDCFEMTRSLLNLEKNSLLDNIEIKIEEEDFDQNKTLTNDETSQSMAISGRKRGRKKQNVKKSSNYEINDKINDSLNNQLLENINSSAEFNPTHSGNVSSDIPGTIKKRGRAKKLTTPNISDSNGILIVTNKLLEENSSVSEESPLPSANELAKKKGRKKKIISIESNSSENEDLPPNHFRNDVEKSLFAKKNVGRKLSVITELNEKLEVSNQLLDKSLSAAVESPLSLANGIPKKRGRKKKISAVESNSSENEFSSHNHLENNFDEALFKKKTDGRNLSTDEESSLSLAKGFPKRRGRKKISAVESNSSENEFSSHNHLENNFDEVLFKKKTNGKNLSTDKESSLAKEFPKRRGRKKISIESNSSETEFSLSDSHLKNKVEETLFEKKTSRRRLSNTMDLNENVNVSNILLNKNIQTAKESNLLQTNELAKKRGRKKTSATASSNSENEFSPQDHLENKIEETLLEKKMVGRKRGRSKKSNAEQRGMKEEMLTPVLNISEEIPINVVQIPKKRGRKKKLLETQVGKINDSVILAKNSQSSDEGINDTHLLSSPVTRKNSKKPSNISCVSNNDKNDSVVAAESHQSSDQCFKDTPLLLSPGSRKSSRKSTNIFGTKYESFVPDFGSYSESKIDSTKSKIQRRSFESVTDSKNPEVLVYCSPKKNIQDDIVINKIETDKHGLSTSPQTKTVKKENFMDKTATLKDNPSVSPKRKVSVGEILISKTENLEQSSSESPKKKNKKIGNLPNKTEKLNMARFSETSEVQIMDESFEDIKDLKTIVSNISKTPAKNVNLGNTAQKTKSSRVSKNSGKEIFACSKINVPHRVFSDSSSKPQLLSETLLSNKSPSPSKSNTNTVIRKRDILSKSSFANVIKYSPTITPSNSEIAQLQAKLIPKSEKGIKKSEITKHAPSSVQSQIQVKPILTESVKSPTDDSKKVAKTSNLINDRQKNTVASINKVEYSTVSLNATNEYQLSTSDSRKRKMVFTEIDQPSPKAIKTKSSLEGDNNNHEVETQLQSELKVKSKRVMQGSSSKLPEHDILHNVPFNESSNKSDVNHQKVMNDALQKKESHIKPAEMSTTTKSTFRSVKVKKEKPSPERTVPVSSLPDDALVELPPHIVETVSEQVNFWMAKYFSFFGLGNNEYRQ